MNSYIVKKPFEYLSEVFRRTDFIKMSTLQMTVFGDDYTILQELIPKQAILLDITFWEVLIGFIITVLALSRFLSLLPGIKEEDTLCVFRSELEWKDRKIDHNKIAMKKHIDSIIELLDFVGKYIEGTGKYGICQSLYTKLQIYFYAFT